MRDSYGASAKPIQGKYIWSFFFTLILRLKKSECVQGMESVCYGESALRGIVNM